MTSKCLIWLVARARFELATRIELAETMGTIPSRSDVFRLALAKYLQVDLSVTEQDRRRGGQKD